MTNGTVHARAIARFEIETGELFWGVPFSMGTETKEIWAAVDFGDELGELDEKEATELAQEIADSMATLYEDLDSNQRALALAWLDEQDIDDRREEPAIIAEAIDLARGN